MKKKKNIIINILSQATKITVQTSNWKLFKLNPNKEKKFMIFYNGLERLLQIYIIIIFELYKLQNSYICMCVCVKSNDIKATFGRIFI